MHVTGQHEQSAHLPPRWFIRLFWAVQRAAYSVSGGRFGLRTATADRWGMLRLRSVGRRSGKERTAILGYFPSKQGYVARQDCVPMFWCGWGGGIWQNSTSGHNIMSGWPTHWMPLPEPPS